MKRYLILGLSGALLTILFAFLFNDLFKSWELKTLDMRYVLRGGIATHPSLIMIDADDASTAVYGSWPWDRSIHAQMLDFLNETGAAVVAYDILFGLPKDKESDAVFIESSKKIGNVVYPVAVSLSETRTQLFESNFAADQFLGNQITLEKTPSLFFVDKAIFPLPELLQKNHLGHIATNRDVDGIVRRVPLIIAYNEKLLPSLAFQTVLKFLQVNNSNVEFSGSSIVIDGATFPGAKKKEEVVIPVDSKGQMLINFAGKWGETFKHASFAAVLSAKPEPREGKFEDLGDKIILIGNTTSGSDMKSVPLEKSFPGPGIHANIINTILTRNFLKELPAIFNISMIFVLSLTVSRILFSRHYLKKIIFLFLLAAGYLAAGIILFSLGFVIELLQPIFSIAVSSFVVLIFQITAEKKTSESLLAEKQKLETVNVLIENERDGIAKIQRGLLCNEHPKIPGLEFFSDYQPSSKAGGDYYDFISIDEDHLGILVSDVSGHGTPAAVIMAMMQALLRSFVPEVHSPKDTLQKLNKTLRQNLELGYFITTFYGVIHLPTKKMKYVSAGHPPPILVNYDSESVQELHVKKGIPLMILPNSEMEEREIQLQPNSKLTLYTDGLTEAKNESGEFFGLNRLRQILLECGKNQDAAQLGSQIREKAQEFIGKGTFTDDYTLVILEITSSPKK